MMTSVKTILVPVDFSEPSKKAVTYGFTVADQFHGKVILAHIVQESSALAFPREEQEEEARLHIKALVPEKYGDRVDVQTIVRTGTIHEELLAIVRDEAVDVVVMGTHGRRYLGRWFLGSVTERMLRQAPVPLLTVSHIDSKQHEVGLVSLKRILYATDLCESSSAGLKYAVELTHRAGAQLTVAHVVYYRDRILWAPGGIPDFEKERLKLVQEVRRTMDPFVADGKVKEAQIEIVIREGKPYETILEIARERAMDLIVLNLQSKSAMDRAFLGSTAERVVRLSPVPVLSIPLSSHAD